MKRVAAILLALVMFAPTIVPTVGAQAPDPGDPVPEDPAPDEPSPDQPDPDQPDPEQPDPSDPPEPGDQPAPGEQPDPPADTTNPSRAVYFEEDFETLGEFASTRLEGDKSGKQLWHVEPIGEDDSMAAVLSSSTGLPRGVHQGLVSPAVDLTPVPSRAENQLATSAAESGVDRTGRTGQEVARGAAAEAGGGTGLTGPLQRNPTVTLGPISVPDGPATLNLAHRYVFDDTQNEQGEAVSGFTIEARNPGGEWVPLEGTMAVRPLHEAGAPGPSQQAEPVTQRAVEEADQNPCDVLIRANDVIDTLTRSFTGREFQEQQAPEPLGGTISGRDCDTESGIPDVPRDTNSLLFQAGDRTLEASTSNNGNVTVLANAYIQPLDQRGFTGVSDTDGDGETETVGHSFDLSPWAGEDVELRLRGGTSELAEVPGGFWAIDRLAVKAPARANDVRLNLTAPSGDHVAPADEPFPLRAQIQNVGFTEQSGPFKVNFTVTKNNGDPVTHEVVETPETTLGFLDTVTAQLDFTPLPEETYSITAELVRERENRTALYPDGNVQNNVDADRLPVRTVEDVDIDVIPGSSVFDPSGLVNATVVVESESNVRIDDQLTLSAFPYDSSSRLPIGGDAERPLGSQKIVLPPSADKHPQGLEEAIASPPAFKGKLAEGAYFLVAELGNNTARAPIGVGTPPPPLMSEDLNEIDPGPASFEFQTDTGTWSARSDSDVLSVPSVVDPGAVENASAWLPIAHESTLLRPEDDQHLVNGTVDTGSTKSVTCVNSLLCDLTPGVQASSPLVLDSPQGTQRVHAMAHDVALHDASRAELEFSSALLPPKDASGMGEARVYVATDTDSDDLASQLTNPINCPDVGPEDGTGERVNRFDCEVVKDQISATGALAGRTGEIVFQLDEVVRCGLVKNIDRGELINETDQDDGLTGLNDTTCPDDSGDIEGPPQTCNRALTNVFKEGKVCYSTELSGYDALAPLLSGTLVHRDANPHTWEKTTIDLSPWAGQNVTVGFVYLSESQTALESYDAKAAYEDSGVPVGLVEAQQDLAQGVLQGRLGVAPPEEPKGAFMLSRIGVGTDEGQRLSPDDTGRSATQPQNALQEARPNQAQGGWSVVGYQHAENLGDASALLKTSAQLLQGDADPVATGADDSPGLQLGVSQGDEPGIRLYPSLFRPGNGDDPGKLADPAQDPAVTVVSTPTVDLTGTENPVVRFHQMFDLGTNYGEGRQFLTADLRNSTIRSAMQVDESAIQNCDVNDGMRDAEGSSVTRDDQTPRLQTDEKPSSEGKGQIPLSDLRCVLEEKRNEQPGFNVQNKVLDPRVSEPGVAAGLFVRAEPLTGPNAGEPQLVEPVDGYRYPIGDEGGFQPVLDYDIESPDAFPGYTAQTERTPVGQSPFLESRPTQFNQTPVFAGDSDVDGDGSPDWVTSALDLSEFSGEKVKLEFVLVARQALDGAETQADDASLFTERPWSIDGVEVLESDVEGEVELEQVRWPNQDLAAALSGEDLPVRLTVTSPTGLNEPVHAKAVLVDSQGCKQAEVTTTARYENEAGRAVPMPAGASFDLPTMVIPGQNVDGTPPWQLKVGVDVGTEPRVIAPSSVEQRSPDRALASHPITGAVNASEPVKIPYKIQDPDCDPTTSVVSVTATGQAPNQPQRVEVDEQSIELNVTRDDGDVELGVDTDEATRQLQDFDDQPALVAVSEGSGQNAGGQTLLLHDRAGDATVEVKAPSPRIPVGTPAQLTVRSVQDANQAYLYAIDPSVEDPEPEQIWSGELRANEDQKIPMKIDEPGPRVLVLVGEIPGETSLLGGTFVVATDVPSSGDPTGVDNLANIELDAADLSGLKVQDVEATPRVDLSTTPREITARVQNTGTTEIQDLKVRFLANGEFVAERSRDSLLPGAIEEFTLPEYRTGNTPSTVIRAEATAGNDLDASGTTSIRSLVKLRSLSPQISPDSDGWTVRGSDAVFQDQDTGEAPKDTIGAVNLTGARMEGLAGVAVELNHDLSMEEKFDGGQVLLSNGTNETVLSAGPATKKMGPFSPVGGKALTGIRNSTGDPVELNATGEEQELQNDNAFDVLGSSVLDGDVERFHNCAGTTYADGDVVTPDDGAYCEWSQPLVPAPESAVSTGLWHFQPEAFLSTEDGWTVTTESGPVKVQAREVESRVYLEAGRNLTSEAQETGQLEIEFDEARRMFPTSSELTAQVCAKFMQVEEKFAQPGRFSISAPTERCTSLNHQEDQDPVRPWSTTTLTIDDVPKDVDYDVVRLEFSFKQDRQQPQTENTGLMGDDDRHGPRLGHHHLQEPVKGWFVGPVTASAGDETKRWEPDVQALGQTDPLTGTQVSDGSKLNSVLQEDRARTQRVIDQFGLFAISEAQVVEPDGTTSIKNSVGTAGPSTAAFSDTVPLTPCQWYKGTSCGAWTIAQEYKDGGYGPWSSSAPARQAMITAPFAMNLTCNLPDGVFSSGDIDEESRCASEVPSTGFGPQILNSDTVDKATAEACHDDIEVGLPTLWRTRCLFVDQVKVPSDDDKPLTTNEEGESLRFATTDTENGGPDDADTRTAFGARGHSVDYRMVLPADLRFAAANAEAWASPDLESLGDKSGKGELLVEVRAQARVKGASTWTDVPVCPDRERTSACESGWTTVGNIQNWVDLRDFVGQEAELGIQVRFSHPTLLGDKLREGSMAFHNLEVRAGYLRLIDQQMRLKAWTDPSIQKDGWTVRGVELFGIPIKDNVGAIDLKSKTVIDSEHESRQMHVHVASGSDEDVFMTAPFNVTVFNQGSQARTVPLTATLEGTPESTFFGEDRGVYSHTDAWTQTFAEASSTCDVELKSTDPSLSIDSLRLDPGTSKQVSARVVFIPDDANGRPDPDDPNLEQSTLEQCFPSQFDGGDRNERVDGADYNFRLHVNVTDDSIPEEDYVSDDNNLNIDLRPNPFRQTLENPDKVRPHDPRLDVTNLTVSPTRPAEDQPVRVTANISLIDQSTRGANVQLEFIDTQTGNTTLSLKGTDADRPTSTFDPYEETRLQWTINDPPENVSMVRVTAQIQRLGETIRDNETAWMAQGSVDNVIERYHPEDSSDFEWQRADRGTGDDDGPQRPGQSREVYFFIERSNEATQQCGGEGGQGGNNPECLTGGQEDDACTPDTRGTGGPGGTERTCPADEGDSNQGGFKAIVSTEERVLEGSPPPIAAIQARWNFPDADVDPSVEGRQAADGWAVQVCHATESFGACENTLNEDGGDWSTVNVVKAPTGTQSRMANLANYGAPNDCRGQGPGGGATADQCTSAVQAWADMETGQDVLAGVSPGYSRALHEEGAFRTVLADLTDCSAGAQECPDWSTQERKHFLKVRVIAFGSSNYTSAELTVSDVSFAPVAFSAEPRQGDTGGFPIPEEAPKAVPIEAENIGSIGTQVDPRVEEPDGWDVEIEGLSRTGAIEASTTPRMLVSAPISPSGVSQSATLLPTFDVPVDPIRTVSSLVPIGVRAGQHPDLEVTSVELSEDPKEGAERLVQVRVRNVGFTQSEPAEVTGVARFDNGRVDLMEPPKDKDAVRLPALPPGVSTTVVLKWTPTASGNATLRVAADLTKPEPLAGPVIDSWDGGEIRELKECSDLGCNNVGRTPVDVKPPRKADTSVDIEVLGDKPLIVGEPVGVRVTVHNDGPAIVPAFEVKLLAGVISLLEDDPLRVNEPLAPGESWSKTVELIPGFGGDLDVQARAVADESTVQELRGLKPGGGTYEADNIESLEIPVVARGLSIDPAKRVVAGDTVAANGELRVPVKLKNLGTSSLDVSAAAQTPQGIGTLVDAEGNPVGSVSLAPGEQKNATLLVLYDELPDAGRQPITIDAVSEAGAKREQIQVEIPRKIGLRVNPVVHAADSGKAKLPIKLTSTGNSQVDAQISLNAPGIQRTSRSVSIGANGHATLNLTTWMHQQSAQTIEGEVTARAAGQTFQAPLRLTSQGDVLPTIRNVQPEGGSNPHTWVQAANLGSVASQFDLTLVQDNQTLASDSVRVGPGGAENVTLDEIPAPGQATLVLEDQTTGKTLNWTFDAPDLRPNLNVVSVRPDPASASAGEHVNVHAQIANNGGTLVTIQPGLFVDGVLYTVSSEKRTVEPGGVADVILPWTATEGSHTLTLDADPQDRISDGTPGDDAMAREIEVAGESAGDALRGVPALSVPLAVGLLSIVAFARSRRDPTE